MKLEKKISGVDGDSFSRKHHQYCKDAGKWQEKTPRVNIVLRE